jgi:hypothetical protein
LYVRVVFMDRILLVVRAAVVLRRDDLRSSLRTRGFPLLLVVLAGCGGGGGTGASATPAAPARAGCEPLVRAASWSHGRLTVVPTGCGRRTAFRRVDVAFREAIRKGGRGAPHRRSLRRQLLCHAIFAAGKPEWHLEKWRPYVSWPRMIATRCNPA